MKMIAIVSLPNEDKTAELIRKYEEAKKALMDHLYSEKLTYQLECEETASGN